MNPSTLDPSNPFPSPLEPFFYQKGKKMASMDEQILRATKEIVVKFIEVGRVSPSKVDELFKDIYKTVNESVRGAETPRKTVD